jgi:hypothetical protein
MIASNNDYDELTRIQSEYTETASAFRHYSALRFIILATFFALVGIILQAVVAARQANFESLIWMAKTVGLLMSLVFWFFESRVTSYITFLDRRLAELEKRLGFNVYSGRTSFNKLNWLRTATVTTILYTLITVFWIASFFIL